MSREIYLAAKKLLSEECSVVPIARGKKAPSIKWEIYQRRLPTEREIYNWFIGTDNQLGLVTGNVSGGRFLVDFDGMICEEAFEEFKTRFPEFENGRTVVTGSGKPHVHGKCPDLPIDFTRKIKHYYDDENQQIGEVDLRGNRHQGLIPPSMHPCGTVYNYVDENDPVTEITRERFLEILDWMDEGQKESAPPNSESENLEADELRPEQKSRLADYYLRRILRQVLINRANRNDKGYELARALNNLKLPLEEAKSLMQKYAEEAPQWDNKEPYELKEAMNSLQSAYNNERESPWIPWGFLEEFQKEKDIVEIDDVQAQSESEPPEEPPPTEPFELNLEYPKDAFKGFVKNFADVYSSYLESPYPFWIFNAATCLGNIFSTRVKLNTSLYTEPRIFNICLGTSGTTRKSESGRQAVNFFEEATSNYEGGRLDSKGEKLPSQLFNTLHGCGSAEGLMDRLELTPNLVLVYDELRAFVQKCDIKGSNLLQAVNTLFESNRLENAVKDKYRRVDNAHLSILAFSTTETWATLFSPNFIDIGFINRLWIVPGEAQRKNFNPEPIPQYRKDLLKGKLNKLLDDFPSNEVTSIEMDYDAELRLQEWYRSFEQTEFTRRLDGYGLRLLQIMAISEGQKAIDSDMAERCISLLEWQRKVREAYQPTEYTDVMSRIQNLIRGAIKRHPKITRGRLMNAIHSEIFDSWKVNKALENLIKNEDIKEIPSGKTRKYVMNKKAD